MTDQLTVDQAWNAVMRDVQAIKKGERNKAQGFNFRGIDTVVNAVGPALREHGVTVIPSPEHIATSSYATAKGTTMFSAIVTMRYTIRGPAGDTIDGGGAFGEAADAGDKAVSKAQSVAERVFLLQALMIPTDDPDPDTESHERAAPAARHPAADIQPTVLPPSGPQLVFSVAANQLNAAQRTELRATLASRGLPSKAADMSDDEAVLALAALEAVKAVAAVGEPT